MKFEFPMPPNRANARGNWRKHHTAKLVYWAKLDSWQLYRRLPGPPDEPYAVVSVTAKLFLWNPMDQGNALNRLKWIEDWLTTRGYVVDDTAKCFQYTGVPTQAIDRKNQRIEVELLDITYDEAA